MQLLPQSNVKPMELHKTAKYNTHPRPWGKLSPISIDQSPWLCQSQSCFHLDCHAAHNRLRWGFMALNHTETTDKKHAFVACLPLQAAGFTGTSRVSLLHSGLSNHFKFLQQSECSPLRSNPWHQMFWRITHTNLQQGGDSSLQGSLPAFTMLLFLPLVVQGRKNYSIFISIYYEAFT